jgi:hypothetical protein
MPAALLKFVIAYALVIVLARFCYWLGTLLIAFPVAGCLAKASEGLRGVVAGVLSGLGGVAASFAFGYFVFRLLFDSSAFSLFPLLAATIPLVIPIRKDFAQSQLLSEDVAKLRHALRDQPAAVQDRMVPVAMAVGARSRAFGAILGIVLAFIWLFLLHENAGVVQPPATAP